MALAPDPADGARSKFICSGTVKSNTAGTEIGELPVDGPAPAILNAVEDAIGYPVNHIPLLPEDLMEVVNA